MSITLPGHSFPYWSDPGENKSPPALVIGAGFSTPQVRLPVQLATHYAKHQSGIEKTLGIATNFDFKLDGAGKSTNPDDLYRWAGRCIEELWNVPGETEKTAKRKFISAIGLLEDQEFAATANIPLRGTTPRHRVLARFAREGCVYSLWSLNWDLWIETAFEAVGLVRVNSSHPNFPDGLPTAWKKNYRVFLPSDPPDENNNCIPLYKPHGCIGAFVAQTDDTFKITNSELEDKVPDAVKSCLLVQLAAKPVCAIGWGATEGNLQKIFEECASAKQLQLGKLTIVSLEWNDGHSNLASNFEQDELSTLCSVQRNSPGTTDDLMQWIQALRTLRRFKKVVTGLSHTNALVLGQIEQQIEVFKAPVLFGSPFDWALRWFDTFVPVWSRVCFSLKALVFKNDGDVLVSALPMIRRDEHIPLNDGTTDRWDILSAANLYSVLLGLGTAIQSELDFETFPGAFWHEPTRWLLIPIPMWGDVADFSLAAIKPLMESRHWNGMSRVKGICLMRVEGGLAGAAQPNDADRIVVWKQGVCSLMKLRAFAREDDIEDCDAFELQTYLQGKKDAI
ncbi:MAG: hypothetical protein Q7T13_14460 [Polaromonas sp.]|nr:hypothetical protein [Polaromonas sp.]